MADTDTLKAQIAELEADKAKLEAKLAKRKVGKRYKYTPEFEAFWKKFRGRWNRETDRYIKVGKYEAFQEWLRLSPCEQEKAIKVAHRPSGQYVPDGVRWLRGKRFDD